MDDKRRKNQLVLAFLEEDRSEAPKRPQEGTESSAGKRGIESPAIAEQLKEEVCERENCKQALKRVKANKGSAGVDGMTAQQSPECLKQHGPAIREQLLSGTDKPQPVKRVEIPKPDGGVRKLGIPTVLDRFVQQAAMQVRQSRWERTFSDPSYGFRPGRSAHQAVQAAQQCIAAGYRLCVDLDLEKFFDRVSHDKLRARIETRVGDRRLLKLIRSLLKAGVREGGLVSPFVAGLAISADVRRLRCCKVLRSGRGAGCGLRSGSSGSGDRFDSLNCGNGEWAKTSPRKRRAALTVRGGWRTVRHSPSRCPMLTSTHSGSRD